MKVDGRVQYTATRAAVTAVKAKTTNTAVVVANEARRGIRIQNDGANNVYLGLGQAAVLHQDILLKPGETWEGTVSRFLEWDGAVNAIAETAEVNLVVVEAE